ncbi:MAG: hypothetical protein H7Z42_06925 [Roseiflexaceae bacterium]|nr:hypothetical protein [Roseiflexaceae bacterium]
MRARSHNRMTVDRVLTPLALGLIAALGLALLLASFWLGAPQQDVVDLVRYLLLSGMVSTGLGAAGVFWLRRGHVRLWMQLALTFLFGVAATIFNIYLTASLMFLSQHDLPLLVLLLAFAAMLSLGLGAALTSALAQRVAILEYQINSLDEKIKDSSVHQRSS